MTNEEKATELASIYVSRFRLASIYTSQNRSKELFKEAVRQCAMKMGEWKDEQYATVVANLLVELDELKHQVKSLLP